MIMDKCYDSRISNYEILHLELQEPKDEILQEGLLLTAIKPIRYYE